MKIVFILAASALTVGCAGTPPSARTLTEGTVVNRRIAIHYVDTWPGHETKVSSRVHMDTGKVETRTRRSPYATSARPWSDGLFSIGLVDATREKTRSRSLVWFPEPPAKLRVYDHGTDKFSREFEVPEGFRVHHIGEVGGQYAVVRIVNGDNTSALLVGDIAEAALVRIDQDVTHWRHQGNLLKKWIVTEGSHGNGLIHLPTGGWFELPDGVGAERFLVSHALLYVAQGSEVVAIDPSTFATTRVALPFAPTALFGSVPDRTTINPPMIVAVGPISLDGVSVCEVVVEPAPKPPACRRVPLRTKWWQDRKFTAPPLPAQ